MTSSQKIEVQMKFFSLKVVAGTLWSGMLLKQFKAAKKKCKKEEWEVEDLVEDKSQYK